MLTRSTHARRILFCTARRSFSKKRFKGKSTQDAEPVQEVKLDQSSDAGHASVPVGEAAGQGAGLSSAERAFIGGGALICGGIGYYVWSSRGTSSTDSQQVANLTDVKPLGEDAEIKEAQAADILDKEEDQSVNEIAPSENADREVQHAFTQETKDEPNKAVGDAALQQSSNIAEDSLNVKGTTKEDDNKITVDPTPMNELFGEVFGVGNGEKDAELRESDNLLSLSKEEEVIQKNENIPSTQVHADELEQSPHSESATSAGTHQAVLDRLRQYLHYSEDVGIIARNLVDAAMTTRHTAWTPEEWKVVQEQAESDANHFQAWREQTKSYLSTELNAEKARGAHLASELAKAEEKMRLFDQRTKQLFEERERIYENLKEKELDKQAAYFAIAAAEASVKESVERSKAFDRIRGDLNELAVALDYLSKQAKTRNIASSIVEGALALSSCLEDGLPCETSVALLKSHSEIDDVVSSVLKTMPSDAARDGVPTLRELTNRFKDVKKDTMVLTMLPSEGGGLLSQAIAKLGSFLKVDEQPDGNMQGSDAGLASAEANLLAGNLVKAVEKLEGVSSGTAAEKVTQNWVSDVKDRAALEQAIKFLRARATCLTASLAS